MLALDADPAVTAGALAANRATRLLGPTRTAWAAPTGAGEGAGHE